MHDDDEPELAGYEPHEKPLRSPHLLTVMRVVVVLGLVGLVLPGILVSASTASQTADRSCGIYAEVLAPEAASYSARFELFGPAAVGWNCYAVSFGGDELLLATLGLIPGAPRLSNVPLERT